MIRRLHLTLRGLSLTRPIDGAVFARHSASVRHTGHAAGHDATADDTDSAHVQHSIVGSNFAARRSAKKIDRGNGAATQRTQDARRSRSTFANFILVEDSTDADALSSSVRERLSSSSRCVLQAKSSLKAVKLCFDCITSLPSTSPVTFKLRRGDSERKDNLLFELQLDFYAAHEGSNNIFRLKGTRYKEVSIALATEVNKHEVAVARVVRSLTGLYCLTNAIISASATYRRWTGHSLHGTMKLVDLPGKFAEANPEDQLRLLEVVLSQAARKTSRPLSDLRAKQPLEPSDRTHNVAERHFSDCFIEVIDEKHFPAEAGGRYRVALKDENTWTKDDTKFQYILRFSEGARSWTLSRQATAQSSVKRMAEERLIRESFGAADRERGRFTGALVNGPKVLSDVILRYARISPVIWKRRMVCNLAVVGHDVTWRAIAAVAEADSVLAQENASLWVEPLGIPGDSRNDLALSLRVSQIIHPEGVREVPDDMQLKLSSRAFYQVTEQIQKRVFRGPVPFGDVDEYPSQCIGVEASAPSEVFAIMDALSVIAQRLQCRMFARPTPMLMPSDSTASKAWRIAIRAWPPQPSTGADVQS
eukprot:GEMP01040932.1.p1 GENE.GEMP01040932.1~~GEMP01040932.1.p1  ORF type:complete len:600 (+),score=129.92 GEMP01040932.1:28-1800(+)